MLLTNPLFLPSCSQFPNWIKHDPFIYLYHTSFGNICTDFFSLLYILLPALAIVIFDLILFFQGAVSECEDYKNLFYVPCFISQ